MGMTTKATVGFFLCVLLVTVLRTQALRELRVSSPPDPARHSAKADLAPGARGAMPGPDVMLAQLDVPAGNPAGYVAPDPNGAPPWSPATQPIEHFESGTDVVTHWEDVSPPVTHMEPDTNAVTHLNAETGTVPHTVPDTNRVPHLEPNTNPVLHLGPDTNVILHLN